MTSKSGLTRGPVERMGTPAPPTLLFFKIVFVGERARARAGGREREFEADCALSAERVTALSLAVA